MMNYIQEIINNPLPSLAIVGNLFIIESMLSIDNAAVLATMVSDLPREQQKKALRYGIFGAYLFRGICMLFASYLINFWFLKPLGGLYLLYLVYDNFKDKSSDDDDGVDKEKNWLYRSTLGLLGTFWATVAVIELMDLAFSIDNVFAVVAYTENIVLVCVGVFIGILAMRLVAQAFVLLMGKYPFLESAAFIVIGILGLKLLISPIEHFQPKSAFSIFLGSQATEIGMTVLTILVFVVPIVFSMLTKKADSEPVRS